MYTAYYYNHENNMYPGIDSNILYVEGRTIGYITSVRTSRNLVDLEPKEYEGILLFLDTGNTNLKILNFNPCPDID